MDSPLIAMIMMWAPNFAPHGWAFCQGQDMNVQQNQALFSLIGVIYGGNGSSTFKLPDLRGRMPMGVGPGPGLTPRALGEVGGLQSVTLSVNNLPVHAHSGDTLGLRATSTQATDHAPTGQSRIGAAVVPQGLGSSNANIYAPAGSGDVTLAPGAVSGVTGPIGANAPVQIMPPYLALNFCIALEGLYPQRAN